VDNKKKESKGINFFSSPQFNQEGNLEWGQLIQKTIALIAFFVVIYSLALYFIKDSYHDIGAWVTQKMGLAGVSLFTFLVDLFIVPMSVDIVFPFVVGWNPYTLLLMMSLASMAGGIGGYWIGRLLGHLSFVKRFTATFREDGGRLINRYGPWAVVIAGITPIPFSTVCWIAGMLKVKWYSVAIATLSRLPRMVIYYLAIRGGLSFIF
jgi:membrane protein YqaA with SNARE-associated domain